MVESNNGNAGALAIACSIHLLDSNDNGGGRGGDGGGCGGSGANLLAWWLTERQCNSGGLNSQPEKQADVCYSWWILLALSIMGRVSWLDTLRLGQFILSYQDNEDSWITDRLWEMPDVYHTFFGLCGLSLIGHMGKIGAWTQCLPCCRTPCGCWDCRRRWCATILTAAWTNDLARIPSSDGTGRRP